MSPRAPLIGLFLLVGLASLVFYFFQRQLLRTSVSFGPHPGVVEQLEASLEDQKRLAALDPENAAAYRQHFEDLETTVNRLRILEHNRDRLARRYQTILLIIFAASVVLVTGLYVARQARNQPRLDRLQGALTDLAAGKTDLRLGERGRDAIGRIAGMVERTSRIMARDRRRLAALENLSAWQEAARRHAHEMRTPLTSAQMELTRLLKLLEAENGAARIELRQATESAMEELGRLARFTERFTSFARLRSPQLLRQDLTEVLEEFVSTFDGAWPSLELRSHATGSFPVAVDREMLRQVLVNLCDNSAQALGESNGTVAFTLTATENNVQLDVTDSGPGICEEIQSRIFEPYTTTRTIGEGMGLGLAISKKILLDHQGDLDLVQTSERGSTFRLTLQRQPAPS